MRTLITLTVCNYPTHKFFVNALEVAGVLPQLVPGDLVGTMREAGSSIYFRGIQEPVHAKETAEEVAAQVDAITAQFYGMVPLEELNDDEGISS